MWLQPQTNACLSGYFTREGMHKYPVHSPSSRLDIHPNKISPNCCYNLLLTTELPISASAQFIPFTAITCLFESVPTCFMVHGNNSWLACPEHHYQTPHRESLIFCGRCEADNLFTITLPAQQIKCLIPPTIWYVVTCFGWTITLEEN